MQALAEAQLEWIAGWRNDVLTALFRVLTWLGDEPFLIFFVALGYWLVDRRVFARAALLLILAVLLNGFIKGEVQEPRPELSPLIEAQGWSFPSGHAQAAAALWGWFAWCLRGRRGAALFWVLALGVALSRPYLGVHYVHDVAAGLLLGALQLWVYVAWTHLPPRFWQTLGPRRQWALGLALLALWVFFTFDPTVVGGGVRLLGALTGLAWGWLREGERFTGPPAGWGMRSAVLVLGIVGVLIPWLGLKVAYLAWGVDDVLLLQFLRYAWVGAWIATGVPEIQRRMGRGPEPA